MKIGFSSLVCPDWDLDTIIAKASEMGFDGVEIRGLRGEAHLPSVSELADDPDLVRRKFQDRNVELIERTDGEVKASSFVRGNVSVLVCNDVLKGLTLGGLVQRDEKLTAGAFSKLIALLLA